MRNIHRLLRQAKDRFVRIDDSLPAGPGTERLESRTLLSPLLLKDIFGSATTSVGEIAVAGETVFFTSSGPAPGLYKSDGTEAGTVQVEQTWALAVPAGLTDLHNVLYFSGEATVPATGQKGYGLGRSDGTAAGATIVKAFPFDNRPAGVTRLGDTLYFSAADTAGRELWRSDGTEAGTWRLEDVRPGASGSNPQAMTLIADDAVYFLADDGTTGRELWVTRGSEVGTVRLTDISPGAAPSFRRAPALLDVGGRLFFVSDGTANPGLYTTDGSAAGTERLVSLPNTPALAGPRLLGKVGGVALFAGGDRSALYRSDGTAAGTSVILGGPGAGITVGAGGWAQSGQVTLFTASDAGGGMELWKTDGTAAGTLPVADINPGAGHSNPTGLTRVGDTVYFAADDGLHGVELWKTDGTMAGTVRVKDINTGPLGSAPARFVRGPDGRTYFAATDAYRGSELWATDGTEAGTRVVKDMGPSAGSRPQAFTAFRNNLFFTANTGDANVPSLFRSDGTPEGTVRVGPGYNVGPVLGDSMYFSLESRPGFFKTDGTPEGTQQILPAGFPNHPAEHLTLVNGALVFTTNSNPAGFQMWRSDGTPEGTRVITRFGGYDALSDPDVRNMAHVGNLMFFYAKSDNSDWEPWRTDGTEEGTFRLKDIRPGYEPSGYETASGGNPVFGHVADVVVGNTWFFTANDGVSPTGSNGYSLWKSNGARDDAVELPVPPGTTYHGGERDQFLAVLGDAVYWMATGAGVGASQLWKSDGTTGGTVVVKEFGPGEAYDTARIASIGGRLFIAMDDDRLWVSDGTNAGTQKIKTFAPGPVGAVTPIGKLLDRGGVAYFWAGDGSDGQGYSFWRSDGTAAGTVRVARADVPPEPFDVNGMTFAAWGGTGAAEDLEPYRVEAPAEPAPAGPTFLSATGVSPRQIDLAWDDPATNERGYRVERSMSAAFESPRLLAVLLPGTTRYSDKDVSPGTTYYYRVYAHNAGGASAAAGDFVQAPAIPSAEEVSVSGSKWSPAFRRFLRDSGLGTAGFAVGEGAVPPLPWEGIDQVTIRFSHAVAVDAGDLRFMAPAGEAPWLHFSYDPDTFAATWTADRPVGAGQLSLAVPGLVVRDSFGFGVPGLVRTLSVLPGDVTRDGRVSALDVAQVRAKLFGSAARPGSGAGAYSPAHDLNGDGRINTLDQAIVRRRALSNLPATAAPVAAGAAARRTSYGITADLLE